MDKTHKHNIQIESAKYKRSNVYRAVCTECGQTTIWTDTKDMAKEFLISDDADLLTKQAEDITRIDKTSQ